MDPLEAVEENRRLRRTMRDLVVLSSLPAVWIGLGMEATARSLAEALLHTLSLDLIYVRLAGQKGGTVEVVRTRYGTGSGAEAVVRDSLASLPEYDGADPMTMPNPFGEGLLHVALTRFGVGEEGGLLISGSCRASFPTEQDRLLLGVAANQIGIVVQRRRAEERLYEQQEWLQVTVASIGDGVIATDTEGRVTFLNSAAEAMTGWTAGDAQGRELESVFHIIDEVTRGPVESPVRKVLREGTSTGLTNHAVLISKDGSERPIDDSAAPIRNAQGRLLGAVLILRDVTEQRRTEQYRNARLAVTQALTQATTMEEAVNGVLRGLGESLGWDLGFFWTVNPERTGLQCRQSWSRPDLAVEEFQAVSFQRTFQRGEGLPGHVWLTGQPKWILDVIHESNFPRVASAAEHGIHSALACPIIVGTQVLGVVEFFANRIKEPDPGLLEMLVTVTGYVGQFMERTAAEEELRQSEKELADFFDNATVGLHWVGPDGQIIRANQAELDMLGYTREEYIGRLITEFHADEEVICDILGRLQSGEKLTDYPARLRCKDGSIKEVLIDSSVLWKNGRFIHTRCFTRDVTERNLAEAKLRAQEQQTRIILESITDAFFALNRNWQFTYINQQAGRLLDRDPEDLLGRSIWEEYPGLAGTEFEHGYHRAASERVSVTVTAYYPDHDRWYEVHIYPAETGLSVYFRDVTDRETAEAAARKRSSQVQRLAAVATRLNVATDVRSILGVINEEARQLIDAHLATTSIVGEQGWVQAMTDVSLSEKYAEWRSRDVKADRTSLTSWVCRNNKPLRLSQAELLAHPDGKGAEEGTSDHPPLRGLLAAPLVSRNGQNLGLIQLSDKCEGDFTADDEAVLVQLAQMASATIENSRLVQDLRDADRRKDEFLATLAHELRNPLAPLRTALAIFKLGRVDVATAQRVGEMMSRQVDQLVRLVDDLLDVSRFMRGKIELRKERTQLATVVARGVETTQPLIETQGHNLEISVPSESLLLDVDPMRLAQVISNLLTNAAKYTPPKGRISLRAWREGEVAVLSVRDNGIGIAPDMIPRVFELFVQADHASTKAQGGLGIGLTLVKNIVSLHGGTIEARSEGLGKGCEFIVRLPLVEEVRMTPSEIEIGHGGQEPKPSGHRLLVVDDNQDAAITLAMLLELEGHEVRVAHDGPSALELVQTFQPRLVFLDIGMPGMDGYEVARRVRQMPGLESVVLVALTGWGESEVRRRTAEAGFNHHLVKPLESKGLEALLASLPRS